MGLAQGLGTPAEGAGPVTAPSLRGQPVQASPGWPQYRHDGQRTGWAPWSSGLPTGRVDWYHRVGPMTDASPVVGPDGAVYVATVASRGEGSLVAVNPNGTPRWVVALQAEGRAYRVRATPAIRPDGALVVVGHRYEPGSGDGSPDWVGKGRVFLISPSGQVERWSEETEAAGLSSPAVDGDGTAYVWTRLPGRPETNGLLRFAADLTMATVAGLDTSTVDWMPAAPLDAGGLPVAPDPLGWPLEPLVPSPALGGCGDLVATGPATVRCWTSGGPLWEQRSWGATTPVVGRAGRAYLVTAEVPGGPEHRLEVVDQDGRMRWRLPLGGRVAGPPALCDSGERGDAGTAPRCEFVDDQGRRVVDEDHRSPHDLCVAMSGGALHVVDPRGSIRWTQQVVSRASEPALSAPVCVQDVRSRAQLVIVGVRSGLLAAFARDGRPVWETELGGKLLGSPAAPDGHVYVATTDALYALT